MKEPKVLGYKFLRFLLYPLYSLFYRPNIIGEELIPKDGPVIICSNHIHLFDQNNYIISTNRMIHYMAKKEHLDGKFGFLFKAAGCIRVDRESHDGTPKREAIKLLNEGYVVGIFPEGTRNMVYGKKDIVLKLYEYYKSKMTYKEFIKLLKVNMVRISELNLLNSLLDRNIINEKDYAHNILNIDKYLLELLDNNKITKEEYYKSKLLPIKYGAVSIAKETGAYIVPCAISGKYKYKKLIVKIGKPFKVDDDLDSANKRLEEEIINLFISD